MSIHTASRPPRIVFFGMPCAASLPPLRTLLASGQRVVTVVLPAGDGPEMFDDITSLARAADVPIRRLRTVREAADVARIASFQPDLIVVACFPWRLPGAVLTLPTLGCINVHPSLLPVGRGPEPVFWTLRRGERETGVTIHVMDEGLDTGPVLSRQRVTVPTGVRAPDLELRLAELGGKLLPETVERLVRGQAVPRPQDEVMATAAPVPAADDFLVPTNLPASWAYGFARGVSPLAGPLAVAIGATGERLPVVDALDWNSEPLAAPYVRHGETLTVRFAPGRVTFRPASS